MFSIDDKFLGEIGLGGLPDSEKPVMRRHIYETLEMRVGMKLASGMSDAQLDEFESLISGDVTKARNYLSGIDPNWEQSQVFTKAVDSERQRATQEQREPNINSITTEMASLKWLETNFPNYKQVVAEELEKLKGEIKQSAPQILAASANSANSQ
jgi:hypothetical protein